jgi:outer membrane cobalamin receptor
LPSVGENCRRVLLALALVCTCGLGTAAQRERGELRIEVRDPQGAGLTASGELLSEGNQFRRGFQVAADGRYAAQDLPFGVYRLTLNAEGFALWSKLVEVRSEVPVPVSVTLGVAPVTTQVQVNDGATLLDPSRTGVLYSVGRQAIAEEIPPQPGRGLLNLVAEQPGWLFEANGVLHPRGSEYDVQFVVDGVPVTQNRSPAFAPGFDADDVESMRILTANYPAEYGRKLGGVVEITTDKDAPAGVHGQLELNGGSFSTTAAAAAISYGSTKHRISLSAEGFHSERYLDPPVLANYTNRGTNYGVTAAYERDFSSGDRMRVSVSQNEVRFLVPNELLQQQAGQRQDISNRETSGQVHFQHTISPELLLSISASLRDVAAALSSNPQATPVMAFQNRGYREGYARADLAGHQGHHDWKIGVDTILSHVHEHLSYTITDLRQFDPGTNPNPPPFSDRKWDVEPAAYVQDQYHAGNWNISAGLRFDHYRLAVSESGWSPRLGVSRFVPKLNLLLHASYDRAFQTPAVENLLLASSPLVVSFSNNVLRLPVRPGRGNFYEAGLSKSFLSKLRLDATVFRRDFRQYSDDDVFLNTGISFPIAFAKGRVQGEEVRLGAAQWWRLSGYLSFTNQAGYGENPITGGLFLGSDAANALNGVGRFADSQDQRNTAKGRIRWQGPRGLWLAAGAQYGSGLPAEIGDADPAFLLTQYGQAVLAHVNLEHGRVGPNFSVDLAAGAQVFRKDQRSAALQVQVANVADRLNVINFASLFSGTAVAAPRSVSAKLAFSF